MFRDECYPHDAPPDIHVPTRMELIRLCTEDIRGYAKHPPLD